MLLGLNFERVLGHGYQDFFFFKIENLFYIHRLSAESYSSLLWILHISVFFYPPFSLEPNFVV